MLDDLVEDISESWTASGSTEAEEDSSAVGEAVDVATDDSSLLRSEEKFPAEKNEAETDGIKSEKYNLPVRSHDNSQCQKLNDTHPLPALLVSVELKKSET